MKKDEIPILYEDDFIVAVNKPPRMASVPAEKIPLHQTVLGKIQRRFEDNNFKPYLLHRLDAQTSGVLLFGKYPRDRQALEAILRHPETQKKYLALVKGIPHGKIITKPLPSRASGEKIFAQTHYNILKTFRVPGFVCALVEATIKMGRRHQIRRHFASIGHPIVEDSKYGDPRFNRKFRINLRLGRQFLHCFSISFFHPLLKKNVRVEAPTPPDLKSVLKKTGMLS